MPGALVEAMWAGLPVVATRVGGVPEVVRSGVDGLLVPPEDAQALADAIEEARGRPELGSRARETAQQHFTLERMVARHIAAYETALRFRTTTVDGEPESFRGAPLEADGEA